ncbi:MAG: hypothetical protein J6A01_11480, partial [Proteobacteria bacterium]|nr:hypothetical protein [Pseudomonadota bacterium]
MKRYIIIVAALCMSISACSDDANKSSARCGNGHLDGEEQCDTSVFAEDLTVTCPANTTQAQTLVCSDTCTIDLEKSCIPVGPKCGDNKLDEGEECDNSLFRDDINVNCPENMVPAQTLVCTDACKIDLVKSCVSAGPRCGDDKLDEGEECDDSQFPENAYIHCPDGTEPAQTLVCSDTCTIDLEQSCVPKCGNGILDEGEECDQTEFASQMDASCPDNYELGQILVCTDNCTIDLDQSCVPKCGNGLLDEGEECDLNEFDDNADASCPDKYEFAQKRVCTETCTIDLEQSCVPKCGNGAVDDDEACDQNAFRDNVEVNCPDKYLVASTLTCTDACEIDIEHSCIAPTCNDGVMNDDKEECDTDQFDPNFDCGKGKHKAETLVCDKTCHVDAAQSCIDDPISPIFTQFVIVTEQLQTGEYGKYSVYDTSLFEVTNVGDGTDGSKCGVYHVNYTFKDNTPVYKATSRVWSFPESMPSGKSVVLCAAGFKKYTEDNAYYTLNEYAKQFCDEILDTLQPLDFSTESDPRTEGSALAIVCGDIAEPSANAPVEVTPVEVLTPSDEYIKNGESVYTHYEFSNGMRRCDQTSPVCSIEKSINTWLPVSSLGRSYSTNDGEVLDNKFYETALFWEDMGKYECKVFKPILTQTDVESHEDDKNIFALEFMNVGLTKDPGHCALYIAARPLGYGSVYPIEKIDIPEIEPFHVWTICSESTKKTIELMPPDAVPPIKLPCDAYISDDKVDHALMTDEKKVIAIYCDENVPVYAESEITTETKSAGESSLLITFRVEGDDTIIRRIRNCNHFERDLYTYETLEFSSDLTQDYGGSKYIKLLSIESDELLKKFSDDFGKYSCPLNVVDEMRCGDRQLQKDNGEECDFTADTQMNYTPSDASFFTEICKAVDSSLVANLSTYPNYSKPEEWYCTKECKLDTEKSCTKCGNGVLDPDELCDKDGTTILSASVEKMKQYCADAGMILRPEMEASIQEGKLSACSMPSCVPGTYICTKCGNGVVDGEEQCDGTEFKNCDTLCGYYHSG